MKILSFIATYLTLTLTGILSAQSWNVEPGWLKLPKGQPKLGSMHGDIAVSSANEILFVQRDELEKHKNNLEEIVKCQ